MRIWDNIRSQSRYWGKNGKNTIMGLLRCQGGQEII